MKLLSYINNYIATVKKRNSAKGSKASDYSQCASSLKVWLSDRPDAEFMSLIDGEFLLDYGNFLFSGEYALKKAQGKEAMKTERLSNSTLQKHFVTFRVLTRKAISDGLLPNIDVFPGVMAALSAEYGIKWAVSARASLTGKARVADAPSLCGEFDKLVNALHDDLSVRYNVSRALPALLYVIGIYANGLEFSDLLSAKSGEPPLNTTIGERLKLRQKAVEAIRLINRRKADDGWLVRRNSEWSRLEGEEKLVSSLVEQLRWYLDFKGINLFKGNSIKADWLIMAAERGVDASTIARLSAVKSGVTVQEIDDAGRKVTGETRNWYVLRSHRKSLKNNEMRKQVKRLLECLDIDFSAASDLYDPQNLIKWEYRGKVVKRNNPLVSQLLFVRARETDAAAIDRQVNEASLVRKLHNRRQYAVVPHDQVVELIEAIGDFRDDMLITGVTLTHSPEGLTIGARVTILAGPFKGREGVIEDIVRSRATTDPDALRYRLRLDTPFSPSATLPGLEIQKSQEIIV